MTNQEPVLTSDDVACFKSWMRASEIHSRTRVFKRRVDSARRVIAECIEKNRDTACMWSAGKDSTAMSHLVTIESGGSVELVSEKDDLDYPGEEDYISSLADSWGARLRIVRPGISPSQWMEEHAGSMSADDDMHSRVAGLSKACFYNVVEEENSGRDAVFLGLRSAESSGRKLNRALRGLMYRKRPTKTNPLGLVVCTPIADWKGIDVYAYLASRGIKPLHVYRCVAFGFSEEPWRVRKSWWIPGSNSRHGGVAWLRHYYPSLYRKLCKWIPDTTLYG